MTEHNKRVIETLNRYIGIGVENAPDPHYAIMLNGAWGCGKTYFVKKKWVAGIPNKEKLSIINVSLFGLKNVDELRDEIAHSKVIFEEFMEKTKKTKKIVEKAREATDKEVVKGISLIFDKVIDSKFGISISEGSALFTRNWLAENKKGVTKVLILDDLERTKMDLKEVFGFVSSYIENTSMRVVFISNDAEIKTREKSYTYENIKTEKINSKTNSEKSEENIETRLEITQGEDYTKIREKVIGETLLIEIDVDDALKHFLDEMNYSTEECEVLTKFIKDAREKLKYENLRVIRQTLIKLHPLLEAIKRVKAYKKYQYNDIEISGEKYSKDYYLQTVAQIFIVANMQKVMGHLEKREVALAYSVFMNEGLSVLKKKEIIKEDDKRKGNNYFDLLLDLAAEGWNVFIPLKENSGFEIWDRYIWNGELDLLFVEEVVTQEISDITPDEYKPKSTLLLLKKGFWNYSKKQYEQHLAKLIKELEIGEYKEVVELVTAYSLFKRLEKWDILEGIDNVEIFFDNLIEKIQLEYNLIPNSYRDNFDNLDLTDITYKGYQVDTDIARDEVVAFLDKLKVRYRSLKNSKDRIDIVSSVEQVISGSLHATELYKDLRQRDVEGATNNYVWKPVLDGVGAEKLLEMLDTLTMIEQRRLFSTLKLRYGHNENGAEDRYLVYKPEKSVLEELVQGYKNRFEKAREERDNKVSMYSYIVKDSEETLEVFNKKIGKCNREGN
jgi:hypothetical protein